MTDREGNLFIQGHMGGKRKSQDLNSHSAWLGQLGMDRKRTGPGFQPLEPCKHAGDGEGREALLVPAWLPGGPVLHLMGFLWVCVGGAGLCSAKVSLPQLPTAAPGG